MLFRYLTVEAPRFFPRPIVFNTLFVPKLSGASILQDGELNAAIIEYFRRELIIDFDERWIIHDNESRPIEHRTWLHSIVPPLQDNYSFEGAPPVLFTIGSIDLGDLLRELGTDADFPIEDPYFIESAFDGPDVRTVPYGAVRDLVAGRLRPIGAALRRMIDIGFREVYLHSVHPPTTDDVRYYRLRHVMSSAKVRYKLAILVNRVLGELARESGARFLDLWPQMLVDGTVDKRLELDGDHLNREAAQLSVRALLTDLVENRGEAR